MAVSDKNTVSEVKQLAVFWVPACSAGYTHEGAHTEIACRGGRIHTQWGCREVLYEETSQGAEATGLRMTKAGKEQIVEADVYVAALDVPGASSLTFPSLKM